MKVCARCKLTKEKSEFYKNNLKSDRLTVYCKTCSKEIGAQTRRRPESIRSKQNYHFYRKYGISIEEQERMFKSQNYRCKICNCIPTKPCVDHCHTTGKIRGILCNNCNFALGMFDDNVHILENALNYLRENS